MTWTQLALILSGGLVMAGISYPTFARTQPGWKTGSLASSDGYALWCGAGAIAYLGGMWNIFGWLGLLLAIPVALVFGFLLTLVAKGKVQVLALTGPVLANLWYMVR